MGDQLDQLEALLRDAPLTDAQRGQLWDAFTSSPDIDALEGRLRTLDVPDAVKGSLWQMRADSGDSGGRPIDPQTGEPVRVPGDPGFVPFGDEPAPEGASIGSMAKNAIGGAVDVLNPLNILSGLYTAATRPGETLSGLWEAQAGQGRQAVEEFGQAADWMRRDGVSLPVRLGNAALDVTEGVGRGIAAAVPLIGPQAAAMGEGIGSGDPNRMARAVGEASGMIAAPALARRAAPAFRRGAENLAARTMRAGDDVLAQTDLPVSVDPAARAAARRQLAGTALDEGVIPGIVHNSTTRPRARMDELLTTAKNQLDSPAGRARVNPDAVRGNSFNALIANLKRQSDWGDDVRQANQVADNAADVTRLGRVPDAPAPQAPPPASVADPWATVNAQSGRGAAGVARETVAPPSLPPGAPAARIIPTARALNEQSTGNVSAVRGKPGVRADAARATARDARREIGRAAPETAGVMERINRLEPVMEAYERFAGNAVDVPGLPTIQARLALAGANRLVGPMARGLNATSRNMPAIARSAVIAELLERAAIPDPQRSH